MFEIKIADMDVTSGSIPVSWCLDLETVAYLSERNIRDPQVVIVTAPVGGKNYSHRKESRKVVPLKDLMAYVEFKSPGRNQIWAFISEQGAKKAKDEYLTKGEQGFISDILDSDGTGWGWRFSRCGPPDEDGYQSRQPPHCSTLTVDVPDGVFAPEPSAWEKAWVNHFFRDKCVDQCEFRRRRLFAYTLQVGLMALQLVVRAVLAVIALLIGSRGFSVQPTLHPLSYSMADAFNVLDGGSIFVRKVPDDGGNVLWLALRTFCLVPFMPLVLIPVVLGLVFAPKVLAGALVTVLAAVLLVALVVFIAKGNLRKLYDKLTEGAPDEAWYMDQEEIELLTCNPEKKALTFATLPEKKRTLKLRFLNLKSKVCRPFSA